MDQPDIDEFIEPFAMPVATLRGGERLADGSTQMPWHDYDEAGMRLIRFAHHGAYDWTADPEYDQQVALLNSLRVGDPQDSVDGETEKLWHVLFAVVRAERFNDGVLANHALALTRIANELRRRLLAQSQ